MKNQYFGDSNDCFKYDLLIFLSQANQLTGIRRLTTVWLLTPDDRSGDGGKTKYEQGVQRESLYRFLQKCLKTKKREVAALSEYFRRNTFDFEYCAYGDRPDLGFTDRERESYFQRIPERYLESAVVFLDPDNGLEVKSAGRSNLHKYVTYDEVGSLFRRMDDRSVLVIYQHLPRVHRKLFLYGTFGELVTRFKCPVPISVSNNQIAFIILTKTRGRRAAVCRALQEYTRSQLEIFD